MSSSLTLHTSQIFSKTYYLIWFLLLICVYVAAWTLQTHLLLNWDVSWLMHASQSLVHGGKYVKDFFELNPPLILFLYVPAVVCAKTFSISLILALRLYIFSLATLSLWICAAILKKLIPDKILLGLFILMLSVVYLIFPVYEFGQREQLLVMFTMPYLLIVSSRLQNIPVKTSSAMLLGLLAALGFGLKPHFIIVLGLIELFYIFQKKSLLAWMRPETLSILALLGLYVLSVLIFFKEYIYFIVPFASHFYYAGFNNTWFELLGNYITIFCDLSALLFFIQFKNNPDKMLCWTLLLAMLGSLIFYILQETLWYYHVLPAFSFAFLILVVLFYGFCKQTPRNFPNYLFAGVMAIIFFSAPVYVIAYKITHSAERKQEFTQLISFLHENAYQKLVYFFTSSAAFTYPLIDYSGAISHARLAFLGWVPGIVKLEAMDLSPRNRALLDSRKAFFISMLADELNSEKPEFVFIDAKYEKDYMTNIRFDYLNYFLQDSFFQDAWKNYHLLTTLDNQPAYLFNVYQRNR
jgi:hypothetical protein